MKENLALANVENAHVQHVIDLLIVKIIVTIQEDPNMIAMGNLADANAQRSVIEIETVEKDAGIKENLTLA